MRLFPIKPRTLLPFLLIACGLYLMVGCIYVPTFQLPKSGPDFRGKVGDANSRKLIRPGAVTRAYVVQLLGPPQDSTHDGKTVAYVMRATDGYWVWPLCFYAGPADSWYRLRLNFDADDQLASYEIETSETGGLMGLGNRPSDRSPFSPLELPSRVRTIPLEELPR